MKFPCLRTTLSSVTHRFNRWYLIPILVVAAVLAVAASPLPQIVWRALTGGQSATPVVISASERQEEEREAGHYEDSPAEAAEFYRLKRLPKGVDEIPVDKYLTAYQQMSRMRRYSTASGRYESPGSPEALGTWNSLGPGNIGGRTRAIVIHPTTPGTIYAAGVAGGVWKTINGGGLWTPISDLMANIAVTTLAMDPTNPNIIYAGTGEGYSGDGVRGAGIFKTFDGGQNWSQLTTTNNSSFYYVTDIVISPNSSQRVYAATYNGVFRSFDGGATWGTVLGQYSTDLAIRTDQSNDYIFSASRRPGDFQGVIYRNTNAGGAGTWDPVYTEAGMGRTQIAIAPSSQGTIYAVSAETSGSSPFNGGLHAVFRSIDGGSSWATRVTNADPNVVNRLLLTNTPVFLCNSLYYNQGWYDNAIAVDPVDPQRVWVGGVYLFRSDDGGANWGYAPCGYHVDEHVIVFHPQYNGTTNKTVYFGNDGGVYRSDDAHGPMKTDSTCNATCANYLTFVNLNNNYGVTQFYHGLPYPDGSTYFGGTQDNGTNRGTDAGGATWGSIRGGDGGYVAVNPTNTNIIYAEYQNLAIQKSTDGGGIWVSAISGIVNSGFLFIVPFMMDPTDSQRLWTGGSVLWRTNNAAANWTQASAALSGGSVSAVAVAPTDANYVLGGTSAGFIHRTTAGTTSTSATAWPSVQPRSGYASWLAFHPTDKNIAFATYSTFGGTHVWKSVNAGANWTPLDGAAPNNIPDVPVHTIVIDPTDTNRLYVGTDVGVFVSTDGGASWAVENTGFANVVTEALALNSGGSTKFLFGFTHGRGAYRVIMSGSGGCPTVSGVSPQVGAVDSTIAILGSGFVGVTGVRFAGNVNAAFTVNSDTRITATVPNGAVDGPITISKTGCPDVQTAAVAVCNGSVATLQVDDNSFEFISGWGASPPALAMYVNRLTPASYPATLSQVQLFFYGGFGPTIGTNINVVVGTNPDGNSDINNLITQTVPATITGLGGFISYDVAPVTINSGDFVVGFSIAPQPNTYPATFDASPPHQGRSYSSTTGTTFSVSGTTASPINWAIRAVSVGCTSCGTITLNPTGLPNGTAGVFYNQSITGSGGTPTYSFAVISGALPTGLSLSLDGSLSGTPSAQGTFSFTIRATDAIGCTGTQAYSITINVNTLSISGTISYCIATAKKVAGVLLTAATQGVVNTTDSSGNYSLTGLNGGSVTVTPTKTGNVNGITSFDASLAAQHAANINTLSACQQVAGDASNNSNVTSFDAALIAQYVAGIIGAGNLTGTWKFSPANRAYSPLSSNQTGQNFDAILVGDVSGNWTPPLSNTLAFAPGARDLDRLKGRFPVSLPEVSGAPGRTVTIPITVGDLTGAGFVSYDFDIVFDQSALRLQATPIEAVGTLSAGMTIIPNVKPGRIRVSAFGVTALTGSGALLNLKFRVTGQAEKSKALILQSFIFNEETQLNSEQQQSIRR